MKLLLVESPAKAHTISKMLGREYTVRATLGHVIDLPEKRLGVDVDRGFAATYVPIAGRGEKILRELKPLADKASVVLLASDPDREGEAIAWHLRQALAKDKADYARFRRVTYNQITRAAITEALAHPHDIDGHLFDAQQMRRVLDRIIGYKSSPLLWRQVKGAYSAGRVQTVGLRLLCEREDAIDAFEPKKYWVSSVRAATRTAPPARFLMRLARWNGADAKRLDDEAAADALARDLAPCRELKVTGIEEKTSSRAAPPPFTTSTLQQAASNALGFPPRKTMQLAQSLYEGRDAGEISGGLITYMRTDSVRVAPEALAAAREVIAGAFGAPYLPAKPNFFRGKAGAQDAHEAIRPTDPARTPESLKGVLGHDEWRLYDLIYRRFLASQMTPALLSTRAASAEPVAPGGGTVAGEPLFRAAATSVVFDGWMKEAGVGKVRAKKPSGTDADDDADDEELEELPALAAGDRLDAEEWLKEEKATKPPARYTEASLVKTLEENGVGRPSTFAQTVSTLLDRKYATSEKRTLRPTELGRKTWKYLAQGEGTFPLFAVKFTAEMESILDRVEEGKAEWEGETRGFYGQFVQWLDAMRGLRPVADGAAAADILSQLGRISAWRAPVKLGKRVYDDKRFFLDCKAQAEGGKPLSVPQLEALRKMLERYQAPAAGEKRPGGGAEGGGADAADRKSALRRLFAAFDGVAWQPARGKYDDRKFFSSLQEQFEETGRLSDKQVAALGKLAKRYAASADGGALAEALEAAGGAAGASAEAAAPQDAEEVSRILGLCESLDWKPPRTVKGKTYDDQEFYRSLKEQFDRSHRLTDRQLRALKRVIAAYANQFPDYTRLIAELGLEAPRPFRRRGGKDAE